MVKEAKSKALSNYLSLRRTRLELVLAVFVMAIGLINAQSSTGYQTVNETISTETQFDSNLNTNQFEFIKQAAKSQNRVSFAITKYLQFLGTYMGMVSLDCPLRLPEPAILCLHIIVLYCFTYNSLLYGSYVHEFDYIQDPKNKKTIEDYIPELKEVRNSLPEIAEDDKEFHSKNTVIGVNGYWYDVENFIPKHPGGPIIKQYIGADVTSSFYGMHRHPDEILRRRVPIAKVKFDEEKIRNKDINEDYWNLWHRYKEIGLFEPNLPWLIRGLACIAINAITAVFSVIHYSDSTVFNGILIGNIFTMSGFMLHDSMHRLVHRDTKICYLLGWICGNIGFGVNSNWWRNEHDPHHAAPNTWDRI